LDIFLFKFSNKNKSGINISKLKRKNKLEKYFWILLRLSKKKLQPKKTSLNLLKK